MQYGFWSNKIEKSLCWALSSEKFMWSQSQHSLITTKKIIKLMLDECGKHRTVEFIGTIFYDLLS